MDLKKLYIIQSITAAANNLRLNSQQIEVLAIIKDILAKSEDIADEIRSMKKVTQLSTFAIRLDEINRYLTQGHIDFFKISDKFREQSSYLIKDLSNLLESATPVSVKTSLGIQLPSKENSENSEIKIDLSKRNSEVDFFAKDENKKMKESFILEDESDNEDIFFHNFETTVLKPVKPLDELLKKLGDNEIDHEELSEFAKIMNENGALSSKVGFEIISDMHSTISKALNMIRTRDLMPGKDIIESIRACLIVIVAVVKGKEVDITNYLNRAESFGRKLSTINVKDNI